MTIVPLADLHLGAAGCDEKLLMATIAEIEADDHCWWISLGDVADFINRGDKRFDPLTVADWVTMKYLADLPKAQIERYLELMKPIAHKCLGLVNGNHEWAIQSHFERDVYAETVAGVKKAGQFEADYPLALGYYGFLQLHFYNASDRKGGSSVMNIVLHHGFADGKLDGSKALNLQRWLWVHDVDLALLGHAHTTLTGSQDGIAIDKAGKVQYKTKKGAFCGTFLGVPVDADPYYERKGYYHSPVGTVKVTLRPGAKRQPDRVKITT